LKGRGWRDTDVLIIIAVPTIPMDNNLFRLTVSERMMIIISAI